MNNSIRAIALYLPQFHPIPENDSWWGKGFTEWTNTAKAKPMFKNHYQPHIPSDLGFYDLRIPEVRKEQAKLAKSYGIEGFCYYHYWFGGRRLLEHPFNEVLVSKEPEYPFCLCWANETWTGIWHGSPNRILIEQTYPGREDYQAHFESLIPAFTDKRYICIEGKPIFMIYKPEQIPDLGLMISLWKNMAKDAGLPGIHLIGMSRFGWSPNEYGFDAKVVHPVVRVRQWISRRNLFSWLKQRYEIFRGFPMILDYEDIISMYSKQLKQEVLEVVKNNFTYPCVIHSWDNTPRSGKNGVVYLNSSPELFRKHLRDSIHAVKGFPTEQRIVFLKSWNEWAEGNHLEPDLRYGHEWLNIIKTELQADI